MTRSARIGRATSESKVLVELVLDGSGSAQVSTGVPFYDHMLEQLGKHALENEPDQPELPFDEPVALIDADGVTTGLAGGAADALTRP